jgi:hypothetical protein
MIKLLVSHLPGINLEYTVCISVVIFTTDPYWDSDQCDQC